jgi:multiple sugar transport system ATP-binding protein
MLQMGKYKLSVPADKAKELEKQGYIGKEMVLGIRPENIHEDEHTQSQLESELIDAFVEVTERLGSETFLYLLINDQSMTARVSPKSKTVANDNIKLMFDMNRIHLFDKETERAIIH